MIGVCSCEDGPWSNGKEDPDGIGSPGVTCNLIAFIYSLPAVFLVPVYENSDTLSGYYWKLRQDGEVIFTRDFEYKSSGPIPSGGYGSAYLRSSTDDVQLYGTYTADMLEQTRLWDGGAFEIAFFHGEDEVESFPFNVTVVKGECHDSISSDLPNYLKVQVPGETSLTDQKIAINTYTPGVERQVMADFENLYAEIYEQVSTEPGSIAEVVNVLDPFTLAMGKAERFDTVHEAEDGGLSSVSCCSYNKWLESEDGSQLGDIITVDGECTLEPNACWQPIVVTTGYKMMAGISILTENADGTTVSDYAVILYRDEDLLPPPD